MLEHAAGPIGLGLARVLQSARFGVPLRLHPGKRDLMDHVFRRSGPPPGSFADLGGAWGIHAACTFYTLDRYPVRRGVLVDTNLTGRVARRSRRFPSLELIEGDFTDPTVLARLARIDVVYLFDVLLHQVAPDWDEVLRMYASVTGAFAIFNPQLQGSERTLRLLDLGREKYSAIVPWETRHEGYTSLFERLDDVHPGEGRRWRELRSIWQWGITDEDLRATMEGLGFEERYHRNWGPIGRSPSFENHAFLFRRRGETGGSDDLPPRCEGRGTRLPNRKRADRSPLRSRYLG